MKIGNPADKPARTSGQPIQGNAVETAKPQGAPAGTAAADASAKVELSNAAAALLAEGTSAEFDAEKVARVEKAIADGTYVVHADVIADKLIGNAKELLSKAER